MKYPVLLFLFINFNAYCSTNYTPLCLANEKIIISFLTKNNKIMSVCTDKDESYLVYRYGTKNKVELEYPKDRNDSWKNFKYLFYLRGGGPENEGIDLNYLIFTNNNFIYTVYEEYTAVDDKTVYGIRIENLKNKFDIAGYPDSVIGTMTDFRNNNKIEKEE